MLSINNRLANTTSQVFSAKKGNRVATQELFIWVCLFK